MRLEDHYEIIRELGQGGYGRVYLVRDRKTLQLYAAKVLATPGDEYARRMFVREVKQLISYRRFRGVIRILREGLMANPPFFVMPYAEGGTITQFAGKLTTKQLAGVMKQVVEPLAQIHSEGGVHRDFKPDNLLVLADRTPALADFGSGNAPSCTIHLTMSAHGTPGYIAPELYDGAQCSSASDVYSVGATWFHLTTGIHPSKVNGPLDPRLVKADTPQWVADWILAMTRPQPAQRPTAFQLYRALHAFVGEKPEPLPRNMTLGAWLGLGMLGVALVAFLRSR